MDVGILGPLEVRADGRAVELGAAKLRALLAVLALHANQPVSAERLAIALWGEAAPPGATKVVQVYVSRLRRALGESDVPETTPAGYRLALAPDELDAARFERAAAAGRSALAAGDVERAAELLRGALGLWRGAPLAEFAWAPFASAEIQRLEELHLDAVETRIEAELAAGRHAALASELYRLTREHPWRERLHVQLMLALYRSGRQTEALEAYRCARRQLVEQLGIEPGPELHRVHQAILGHDRELDTGAKDESKRYWRAGVLPVPPNRTIGRADELRAVAERLRAGGLRLLTLTGPGGVGKTRLALEAARAVEPDYADGASFVSLAAVARARDVAGAIVSALGIVPVAGESTEEAVERFVAVKNLLLVIDNCEHLPAATPFIGRLPAGAAGLTVLATSREPLAVQAEHVFPVPPLALPEPTDDVDLGTWASVEAVTLFCERARAHDPSFELSDDNAGAVAATCRRLDGLPLAIELAAARCLLLSPSEIAARLGEALGALGHGPRDAPARQQTLRATLDWSHDLLDHGEQSCVARFAVFAGGATVEAAQTITGANLDTLDRLVAKSLLVRRQNAHGLTRLGMLRTVKAYAAERFAALVDSEAVREEHFVHFLAFARVHGIDSALDGPNRDEHLACLDSEVENLRAALHWAYERGDSHRVLGLSAELVDYWMRRDRYTEAVDWVLPAVRQSAATADPALRARALSKACWPLWALGRSDDLLALLSDAEEIARTVPDLVIRAEALYNCAALRCLTGRSAIARPIADEALACAHVAGDAWTTAMAAWARAMTADDADELHERVEAAASLLADVGNGYHLASLFTNAVSLAWERGCDADADTYLARAVPLVRCLDQPFLWMCLLGDVAVAALLKGDTAAADDAFREMLTVSDELVLIGFWSSALSGLAAVAAERSAPERAAWLAGAAAAHNAGIDELVERRIIASYLEPARARYGPDAWDAAAAQGAVLTVQEATVYALDGRVAAPAA
jgi:predicted ATPase/DNA-binding SARP family transcriptional activator